MADSFEMFEITSTALLEKTADNLSDILKKVADEFEEFPVFPGAIFAYGIEIECPESMNSEYGCLILGNDGGIYEFQIGLDPEKIATGEDPMTTRDESLIPIELPAEEYIPVAAQAIRQAVELLRQAAKSQ